MSYPDVIKARDLRQHDRVYGPKGEERRVLATCWKPGYSFIVVIVEGENIARRLPIGRAVFVRRAAA